MRPRWARALPLLAAALVGCRPPGSGSGQRPPVGSESGHTAPALRGTLGSGEPFALEPGEGGAVLVFYRGGHCGLCRERLRQLQHHLPAYEALEVRVVAASPEAPEQARRTAGSVGAEFPVVSVDSATLEAWRLRAGHAAAPVSATFLVDADGVIRFDHRGEGPADRVSDVSLLTLLQSRRAPPVLAPVARRHWPRYAAPAAREARLGPPERYAT